MDIPRRTPQLFSETFRRRFRNGLRTLFARGDASTLLITCILMVIPVLALTRALNFNDEFARQSGLWPVSLNQLIPIAILSVAFGFLLARSHYSEVTALLLSSVYSIGAILLVQFVSAPGNPLQRVYYVLQRFVSAIQIGSNTSAGIDPYLLVVFLSILIWFLGHNTAWHTFRLDRVWRAVLPPGIVLVLNSMYNTAVQANQDMFLFAYLLMALLLVIRSHIEAREFDWYMNRVVFRGNIRKWFFRFGAMIALLVLIFAWMLPTGPAEENAKRFQQFLNQDFMTRLAELLNRLFGSLEGQTVASADYYGGDKLTLGGAIQLGDQIVMTVKAPQGNHYYWKSRSFETYNGAEWTSSRQTTIESKSLGLILTQPDTDPTTRKDVEQQITMALAGSKLLYSAPQPKLIYDPVHIDVDYVQPPVGGMDPSVIREITPVPKGGTYRVLSSISIATDAYLRAAGNIYPSWVFTRYLQLPPNISPRTRNLAQQIIAQAGARTQYDKAKAIESWLRSNIQYKENIAPPPPNRELVDWVLFDQKEAYCTYYASAMVVMLRTLGLPARVSAGFAMGVYDPASQSYVVRERDAHTWVEVFFPGAGWVEFEPTSAQRSVERSDQVSIPPTQTPTPTPTPSPTPTVLITATEPRQAPLDGSPTPKPLVTFTSTPEAPRIPTVTPTVVKAPAAALNFLELPPPVQNFLAMLLVAGVVLSIVSFFAVGMVWYVDYRGLDHLGPIGRAYARMGIYARWLGIHFRPGSTPLERGKRIAREVPKESRPVIQITDAYINERYGPPSRELTPDEKLAESAWRQARRAFVRRRVRQIFRRGGDEKKQS